MPETNSMPKTITIEIEIYPTHLLTSIISSPATYTHGNPEYSRGDNNDYAELAHFASQNQSFTGSA